MLKFCVDYVTAIEAKRFEVNLIVTFVRVDRNR